MKNWTDENLWFDRVGYPYKKMVLQSLSLASPLKELQRNGKDLTFLFEDIDVASYILSHYFYQKEDLLQYKNLKNHLKDKQKAHYILQNGCLDTIIEYILKIHPSLEDEKSIIRYYAKINPRALKYFHKTLKEDKDFIASLIKEGLASEQLLEIHPQDTSISIALLKKGIVPRDATVKLFSPEALKNKAVVKKALVKNGHLYRYLPAEMQEDINICKIVEQCHSYIKVKKSYIDTMEKFMDNLDNPNNVHAKELATLSSNILKHDFIKHRPDNLLKIFDLLRDGLSSCQIELMGGAQYNDHPIQELFLKIAEEQEDIKAFVQLSGKFIIDHRINDYSSFSTFESKIIPQIANSLREFLTSYSRMKTLQQDLPSKKAAKTKKI